MPDTALADASTVLHIWFRHHRTGSSGTDDRLFPEIQYAHIHRVDDEAAGEESPASARAGGRRAASGMAAFHERRPGVPALRRKGRKLRDGSRSVLCAAELSDGRYVDGIR